jgi:thiamine pyrophosphate-dependent acetolactate synthase large subunit-like protein
MSALEAVGYAKFTDRVGVCAATSGPGAIHLLNGLYDAKLDHVPVVAIVGQTDRSAMGGAYQQEVDLLSLFKDVAVSTSRWSRFLNSCRTFSTGRSVPRWEGGRLPP